MSTPESRLTILELIQAFSNAVNCFQYVRFGRHSEIRDLTWEVDLIQLRLSRWGKAIGFSDFDEPSESPKNERCVFFDEYMGCTAEKARNCIDCLRSISDEFTQTKREKGEPFTGVALEPSTRQVHEGLTKLSLSRIPDFMEDRVGQMEAWVIEDKCECIRLVDLVEVPVSQLYEHVSVDPAELMFVLEDELKVVMQWHVSLIEKLEKLPKRRDPILSDAIA
jgi:hypothetical protein